MKYWPFILLCIAVMACNQPKQKSFVVTKVRAAAKLSTTEVILNKIVWAELESDNWIRRKFFSNRNNVIIFNTEATVKLGVDLKKLTEEDIEIYDDSLVIMLPKIEVLNFSYPHEKYEEVFPISNFDNCKVKGKVEELDKILRLAEKDIRTKIKLLKLKDEAEFKTRQLLSTFLTKSNFNNVIIHFKE